MLVKVIQSYTKKWARPSGDGVNCSRGGIGKQYSMSSCRSEKITRVARCGVASSVNSPASCRAIGGMGEGGILDDDIEASQDTMKGWPQADHVRKARGRPNLGFFLREDGVRLSSITVIGGQATGRSVLASSRSSFTLCANLPTRLRTSSSVSDRSRAAISSRLCEPLTS